MPDELEEEVELLVCPDESCLNSKCSIEPPAKYCDLCGKLLVELPF